MLANSKLARQITSRAFNPDYTFTSTVEAFSLGELAAPIIAFGDMDAGLVNRTLVEYFFGGSSPKTSLSKSNLKLTHTIIQKTNVFRSSWDGPRGRTLLP